MNSTASFRTQPLAYLNSLPSACLGILMLCLVFGDIHGQEYHVIYNLPGPPGGASGGGRSALAQGPDGFLYGTTFAGSNNGFVYKIQTNGSSFTVLKEFTQTSLADGAGPRWLLVSGTMFYGAAYSGGVSNLGTLFRMNSDGNDYTVLKTFTGSDGASPMGLALGETTLYGTTISGGDSNCGVLFKLNTDGGDYTVLKSFNEPDGISPFNLVLSGATLYGVTADGGSSSHGTIFSIQTDGTGYAVLKSLDGPTDGISPVGSLLLVGTTLYGTAAGGGPLNGGTVFKIGTDGSGFAVLKSFAPGSEAWSPHSGLVLDGDTLYGTTFSSYSPFPLSGTIFKLNTDGSGFSVLKTVPAPAEGYRPLSTMCLLGSTLYGAMEFGGSFGHGVVFSLSLAPPGILRSPPSQTAEAGDAVSLRVNASGSLPLFYSWYFNDTNLVSSSTNSDLKLLNVQSAVSGVYTVVVTNSLGAVTSAPAMLQVIPAVGRRLVPGIALAAEPGSAVNIEYTDFLLPAPPWITLDTVTMTATSQLYFDLSVPLPLERFYRISQPAPVNVVPALNLNMVPAITLTGSIGDSLRLDYINAIGPIDAWVTLDTVTLTNTSQLYFDTSSIGQPPRLYRLVQLP